MTTAEYECETRDGKPAQARVRGILRGGFLVGTTFYYFGICPEKTDDYTDLQIRGEHGYKTE